MSLEDLTLMLFTACNSVRIFAYIPQMRAAALDKNGASAISYTTWGLFLLAHLSTVAYALINRADWSLALCFMGNALCCVAILAITFIKRRQYLKGLAHTISASPDRVMREGRGALKLAATPTMRG
jgi:hypothetical protein